MKKFLPVLAIAISFIACNGNTELAVKNANGSDGSINDIVWQKASGSADTSWSEEVAQGSTSSAKEVGTNNGKIECTVEDGGDFVTAEVRIAGESGNSVSLNDGESQVLTVTAISATSNRLKANDDDK